MGCDIHVFVEQKIDNKWFSIHIEDTKDEFSDRDYFLFAKLADVRNYYETIPLLTSNRGVPEDCNLTYKNYIQDWGVDLHSHTYYYLSELDYTLDYSKSWDRFIEHITTFSKSPDKNDIRILIAFDN